MLLFDLFDLHAYIKQMGLSFLETVRSAQQKPPEGLFFLGILQIVIV